MTIHRAPRPSARCFQVSFGAFVLAMMSPSLARACPVCETSVAVWHMVVDEPLTWLLASLAPFAVVYLLGAARHWLDRPARGRRLIEARDPGSRVIAR